MVSLNQSFTFNKQFQEGLHKHTSKYEIMKMNALNVDLKIDYKCTYFAFKKVRCWLKLDFQSHRVFHKLWCMTSKNTMMHDTDV